MMKLKTAIILIFLCLGQLSFGQVLTTVQANKDSIKIGQVVNLIFTIFTDNPDQIKELQLSSLDSMQNASAPQINPGDDDPVDYEIIDYGSWPANQNVLTPKQKDWVKNSNGYFAKYNIQATIWDFGVIVIPGLTPITIDSTIEIKQGQPKMIYVKPPQNYVHQDSTVAIADIKPIIEQAWSYKDVSAWVYMLLGSLLALLIGWFLYNKFKKKTIIEEEEEDIYIPPAHITANEKLDDLKSQELWQKGEIKSYQSSLTFIIREYLENRYNIKALESTTDEINKALIKTDFDDSLKENVQEILTMADLVKFAKAKPGESIHASFMDKAYELVDQTKLIEDIADE